MLITRADAAGHGVITEIGPAFRRRPGEAEITANGSSHPAHDLGDDTATALHARVATTTC